MHLHDSTETLSPYVARIRWLMLAVLLASAACYAVFTWHWMLLCDSPIMHYVNLLMTHGMKPYADISDNNLPGSYLSESLAMHLFGAGDLGWRLYEFFLLAAITTAMALITRPWDWAAGIFAGISFLLLHGKEGPWFAGERELTMSLLVLAGYAALFTATRRRSPGWMLAMGFTTAFAASIKPTVAPLGPLLLVMTAIVLHRRKLPWLRYILLGLTGMLTAAACNIGFLLQHHAWSSFLQMQRTVTPYYASLLHATFPALVTMLLQPRSFLLLPAVGLVLASAQRRWTWEQWALALGAAVGLFSYFAQRKGFLHHRYLLFLLLFLLIGIELMRALRTPNGHAQSWRTQSWRTQSWRTWLSAALILYVLAVIVPHSLWLIHKVKPDSDLTLQLEADLNHLGGTTRLQHQVQCLDLVYGCLNALYRLQLVENTGFTGDLLVFDPANGPQVQAQRASWWQQTQQHPPAVLVMTNQYFQGENTYSKLENWPAYAHDVQTHYRLLTTRTFPDEFGPEFHVSDPTQAHGYRIYVRNKSSLPPLQ